MLPISNCADWAEAWAVCGAVLAASQPEKRDHFAYFLLLASAQRGIQGTGWLEYDVAFRKHAAETPSIVGGGEVMPTL